MMEKPEPNRMITSKLKEEKEDMNTYKPDVLNFGTTMN